MRKIAIQGIAGSYHHEAALDYLKSDFSLVECDSFRKVGMLLRDEEVDTAIMAIENTIAGSILSNYALISRLNLKIVGEVYLRIHHHLMCHPTANMDSIKEIQSHSMALLQCEDFFETVPHIKIVESIDTAQSAKDIHLHAWKNVAAIAPKKSAEIYDLKILNDDIQTNKDNFTRFFILSKEGNSSSFFDKVSLRFSLLNYAGSLASVLQEIADAGVNMTKIQSVPIIQKPGEYSFYVDFLVESPTQYHELMSRIQKKISDLEILGTYKNGKPLW